MMGLSAGRKSFQIGLAVLIQYRRVTDTQPASEPPSHVAVASTRYEYLRRAVTIFSQPVYNAPLRGSTWNFITAVGL